MKQAKMIGFVPCKNFSVAKRFYGETLGFLLVKEDGYALVFDCEGIMLRIAQVDEKYEPAPFTILGWEVSPIENTVRELHAKDVQFTRYNWMKQDELGIWTAPSGDRVAWFKDPDGNTLSLSEHRK